MVSLPIVFLIFISSNSPQEKSLNEGIVVSPTPQPQKGFVDNGKSPNNYKIPVSDLTTADFKFPDDKSKVLTEANKKIIREKIVPDEENDKTKAPVPLYSLVKNDCGEGYALDENGVCQKTIAARSGKKLDAEKRRKRHILSYEWLTERNHKRVKRNLNEHNSQIAFIKCSNLYPGLIAEENGGCRKAVRISEQPFEKTLPP